jgi:phenylalanine-4-hydroxylase
MDPTRHAGGVTDLVELDPDHPGFRDAIYRQRRNEIAAIALAYPTGTRVPDAPYTPEEQGVWRAVWAALDPLHHQKAATQLVELANALALPRDHIPQLSALNGALFEATGYRMEPVAGLVSARTFLQYLGRRIFLSTQYIRHHSRPFYTPEPDVVHELVGHAATLVHPAIAEVNHAMGQAAHEADDVEMARIERVYWYTMEFGVVQQDGVPKAFGAGLLSSVGELQQMDRGPELLAWDLDAMAHTPYDPTAMQPALFVAPSFDTLLDDVLSWTRSGRWRTA